MCDQRRGHAVVHEVFERSVRGQHAERAVLRADQITGGGDDPVEHRAQREVGGDDAVRGQQPVQTLRLGHTRRVSRGAASGHRAFLVAQRSVRCRAHMSRRAVGPAGDGVGRVSPLFRTLTDAYAVQSRWTARRPGTFVLPRLGIGEVKAGRHNRARRLPRDPVRQTQGMPETVEIGLGRSARRGYHLDDIALVPTRRTRGQTAVSTAWQMDAHAFELPFVTAPAGAVVAPATAAEVERLGGLAVLDGEGVWCRYEDAGAELAGFTDDTAQLQEVYSKPVVPALLRERIRQLRSAGVRVAVRLSPQHTAELAPHALAEGLDLLVIQGTVISAEHVVREDLPGLNLKTFIADLDVPVLVGGVTNYQTALHLMRTGAAGVIIGYGAHVGSTTHSVLGIEVPMATALVDAAAARRDYLDETGGRYVHLVAYGDMSTGGDIAKALACGADAVMLGEPLAAAVEAPGGGRYWDATASHPRVPRSSIVDFAVGDEHRPTLEELLLGPTADPSGESNLFGAVRRVMGKCGYSTLKEFQKAELVITTTR